MTYCTTNFWCGIVFYHANRYYNVIIMLIWMYLIYLLIYWTTDFLRHLLFWGWNAPLHCRADYYHFILSFHVTYVNIVPHEVSPHYWRVEGILLGYMGAPSSGIVLHSASQKKPRSEWNCSIVTWMLIINAIHRFQPIKSLHCSAWRVTCLRSITWLILPA